MSDRLLARIARGESDIDVVGRARTWATISGVMIVLSLIGLFGFRLNLGQEFTGGTSLRVTSLNPDVEVADVEEALADFNLGDVKIQIQSKADPTAGPQDEILVRSAHIEDRDTFLAVQETLAELAGHVQDGRPDVDQVSIEDVGPTWGRQVSSKALQGLIFFLILVSLYISLRFEWKMALGALLALVHDLTATAGLYALVGFVVTPATVIALLTLLGYSLYDTVVVFDKIQENANAQTATGRSTYSEIVNRSANQVMMRSINTSLSTMLPIGSLLFVGVFLFRAETLKDLALAMFIGTIVGTYSSLFVASPFLAFLKEREPRYRAIRARRQERAGKPDRRAEPEPEPAPESEDESPVAAPPSRAARPVHVPRGTPRPRKRKRGKRRR